MTTLWVKAGGSWSLNPGGAGNSPSTAGTSHADVTTAIAAMTADGDVIKTSSAHTESSASAITHTYAYDFEDIVVDDTTGVQITSSASGASITTTSGADIAVAAGNSNAGYISGYQFITDDLLRLSNSSGGDDLIYEHCLLKLNNAAGCDIELTSNSNLHVRSIKLLDTIIERHTSDPGAQISTSRPIRLEWIGGSHTNDATALFRHDNYAMDVFVRDVGLSAIDGALVNFVSFGSSFARFVFQRCKLHASVAAYIGSIIPGGSVVFDSCDTGDGYNYFEEHYYEGNIVEDTAVYRTDGATYDGTNFFSALMETSAAAIEFTKPLRFKLADLKLDLSSSTTLTVELAQYDSGGAPTALTDKEFKIIVERPDGTDQALGVIQKSTTAVYTTTGTNLTTSTKTWSETTNITKQKAAVTIGALSGVTDAAVSVWAELSVPSLTTGLNVCPKIDVS